MTVHSYLEAAIASAASYLKDACSPDFLWRDFKTLAGESCDWVSGFVAFYAGNSSVLRGAVRETIRALLQRQRRSGGWAYNEHVPPDCDSTAWILLAMTTTTVWKPSMVLRALEYVRRHTNENGFATYAPEDEIERFIGATPEQTEGWRGMHICVTAVAIHALSLHGLTHTIEVQSALAVLRDAQNKDGVWTSYWWRGPAYATAQSLRALAASNELSVDIWHRAADGLMKLQGRDGGFADVGGESHAFATAMSLIALLTRPDPDYDDVIDAAASWLLDEQCGGHWASVPILRIPRPITFMPELESLEENGLGSGTIIRDQHSIFTTAAALAALTEYRAAVSARA